MKYHAEVEILSEEKSQGEGVVALGDVIVIVAVMAFGAVIGRCRGYF